MSLGEIKKVLMDDKTQKTLALFLPAHIEPRKFVSVALTAVTKNPDLALADRQSFFAACQECARRWPDAGWKAGRICNLPDQRKGARRQNWHPGRALARKSTVHAHGQGALQAFAHVSGDFENGSPSGFQG